MFPVEKAYQAGVRQALFEKCGYVQTVVAPVVGAIAAPEGEGWRGASGATLGSGIGSLAGGLGGGLLGAGIGALAGGSPGAALGASIGGGLGAIGGGIYGGIKGYRAAVLSPEERAAIRAKLREVAEGSAAE